MHRAKTTAIALSLTVVGVFVFVDGYLFSSPDRSDAVVTQVVAQDPTAQNSAAQNPAVAATNRAVRFVGHAVCKECHEGIHEVHSESGHASTFATASDPVVAKRFVGKTFDGGEAFGSYSYSVQGDTLEVRLKGQFGDSPFPFRYALGSTDLTLMSLISDGAEGTVGIEHRASWYGTADELAITPGQESAAPNAPAEHFGIAIRGETLDACIGCHTTSARIVGQEIHDLIPNVNCESCHGAGSEHVRQARLSDLPPPYAVGREEWNTEMEIRLCGSCHRMPINLSVKELRDYPDKLVRYQPVGLLRSQCYLETEGHIGCTACHDPHAAAKRQTPEDYVQACVDCHQQQTAGHVECPVSPTEGCIECHMPRMEFEHGLAFHDHWIRVRDDKQ